MNLDLPQHLHATRDLLIGSLKAPSSEPAPALPAALLEDLTRTVAIQPTEARENPITRVFESLQAMVGSSSFGTAAAALMILVFASAVVLRPDAATTKDTFRGASAYSAIDTARVILIGAPVGMQSELEATTDFEDGVFSSVARTDDTNDLKGARVIVNFEDSSITAINAKGESVYQSQLPESSSGLSLKIASALTRL